MINVSNFTSKNNPQWPPEERVGPAQPPQPRAPDRTSDATAQASLIRILASVGRVLLNWLAAIPRRVGDRLFFANDTEAYWRDWQIIKTHGGLARRYRDPRFGTLAECPKCHGVGITGDLPCAPCLGTGGITLPEVS